MKFLRLFGSTSQRDAVLASIDYKILQKTEGIPGVGVMQGTYVPEPVVDLTTPFFIKDVSGSENTVQIKKSNNYTPTITIEKSVDGTTWEPMGETSTTEITATIPANGRLYLRCGATQWANSSSDYNFIVSTNYCNVGGNIMSLLYGSNFTGNETTFPSGSTYTFYGLFFNNTHLIDTSNLLLPATTLVEGCYAGMFNGCTSLTTAPVLPATTLAAYCYNNMFAYCTSLTSAPALPATTLAQSCYWYMFSGCTSLTTTPELPATTLANRCYEGMFQGCMSLTSAPASLPATTLANYCYNYMFYNCKALTTAPELPATTLVKDCYRYMFQNCTSLNYIKCLATNISASNCTNNWVQNVASSGTFVKNPSMSGWTTGNNGIPFGWTSQSAA